MGERVRSTEAAVDCAGTPGQDQAQYLTFVLGGEMYAIGILNIKEIIEYGNLTVVPMMPDFLRGVINLRGRVVPVVDLSARFGRGVAEVTPRTCIVLLEVETASEAEGVGEIGVMVDSVSEVLEIPREQIEPTPAFGAKIRTDFIEGMGKVADRFVVILNVGRVFSLDEIAMLSNPVVADEPNGTPEAAHGRGG
jgi:purine-binding chemotaxis protein CheW